MTTFALDDLTFTPFDMTAYQTYRSWFIDPELRRRISEPDDVWFAAISTMPATSAWLVYEGETAIGQLQMDTEQHSASIAYVVNPEMRGKGYGKRLLRFFLARPETQRIPLIEAFVELDNSASIHVLRSVGFIQQGEEPDEDGCLRFVYINEKPTTFW